MVLKKQIPSYKINEVKNTSPEEKDFELYQFPYFANNIDHLTQSHRHDHFVLFFVTGGQGGHLVDFKEYELLPRRLFLIAPGQIHAWKSYNKVQGLVLL